MRSRPARSKHRAPWSIMGRGRRVDARSPSSTSRRIFQAYQIPVGAAAQVAIYTKYWHHVSLLRKILLRMRSWQNYVFLEGH